MSQILSYATIAGVEWCVLTDGDEYRFYNANAPVDAEEKLFCLVKLSKGDEAETLKTLTLISRSNMEENLLDVLWNAHYRRSPGLSTRSRNSSRPPTRASFG